MQMKCTELEKKFKLSFKRTINSTNGRVAQLDRASAF